MIATLLGVLLLTACGSPETKRQPTIVAGQDGQDGRDGRDGKDGRDGVDGRNGQDGRDGKGCVAQPTASGIEIQCGDSPSVHINHGIGCTVIPLEASPSLPAGGAKITCVQGEVIISNGKDAPRQVIEYLDPCGPSGGHDEILLRLSDGTVAALFVKNSSALTARLSILKDSTYITTDDQHCVFTLSTNDGIRTLSSSGFTTSWEVSE